MSGKKSDECYPPQAITEPVASSPTGEVEPSMKNAGCTSSILSVNRAIMRSPLPPFHPGNFAKYAWYDLDEASFPLLEEVDPVSRRAYERLGRLPGAVRYELGNFRIDRYRTISFELIPALGEVGYSEATEYPPGSAIPPDRETQAAGERSSPSPLMRFLQLTDKDVPVPSMLEEFDDGADDPAVVKLLAGRDLVELTASFGTRADFHPEAVIAAETPAAVAASVCFSGGDDVFSSTYCESKGMWYCDSGAWVDLTRSSGSSKHWVSHSRVASCSDFTWVEHQYRFWSWWQAKWVWTTVKYPLAANAWYQEIPPGGVKYWKHVGNKKRRRRIRAWAQGGTGYFRAWTAFYN